MKLPSGFWQGAAAASSLLLACGYVAYSAGSLHLGKTIVPPVEQPALIPADSGAMFPSSKRGEMFSSSKSIILVDPADQPAPIPPIVVPPSRFMGGSKSAPTFTPPPAAKPTGKALPYNGKQQKY